MTAETPPALSATRPLAAARQIMEIFARETGLVGDRPPRRYLWTDAFAVCNYLGLYEHEGNEDDLKLGLQLVDQVHHVLGQHRPDSGRSGWISGLGEEEGEEHPTAGGLRIGKKLPERKPDEPFNERLEWERDGQYYHYLTKWMHALNRITEVTGDAIYNRWGRELAAAAHAAFVYQPPPGGQPRMFWKMSVDLSRPLVPTMGHHDPLDGYLTYQGLEATADALEGPREGPDLEAEIAALATICRGRSWATSDPLGLGGLLTDLYRAAILPSELALVSAATPESLLRDALHGMQAYAGEQQLQMPARYRLAFRELGLSIGLHAIDKLREVSPAGTDIVPGLNRLLQFVSLADAVESFWLDPAHRRSESWTGHIDINRVMLATSLAPAGYLGG